MDALSNGIKAVFTVPGSTHILLYDRMEYINTAVDRLTDFFRKSLPEQAAC